MRGRSIVLLAGGLLALAIAPPVFGAGDSTTPPPGSGASPTTATTAPPDDDTMPPDDGDTGTPPDDDTGAPPDDGDTGAPPDDDTDMTTSTTAPDADATAPSDNCATPETLQEPAPPEGETVIYPAGEAGEVEMSRVSPTELEIISATAADGWTAEVTEPNGPRVKVRFVDSANPSSKTRFAASMDQKGEEIHVRVTNCS